MERKQKFSIWYVLLGIWFVLIIQNYIVSAFAIKTIPYSEFLKLLKENKVAEVAIGANQIQGKLKEGGVREIIHQQYTRALEILQQKRKILNKGAGLLLEKEKIEGTELKALMVSN